MAAPLTARLSQSSLDVDAVSGVLRSIADELILPRFRRLQSDQVFQKAPGDLVTVVDREVEAKLAPALRALVPGSLVVGEEAASEDSSVLGRMGSGWVWTVDPVDGTANFVAGLETFASMVGLLRHGVPVAGWIYAPVSGDIVVAEAGSGATCNGVPLTIGPPPSPEPLRGMALTRLLPPELRDAWEASGLGDQFETGSGCAGVEYPALVAGDWGSIFFWRTLPWDHVPGCLVVKEAGGHVARLDGTPYVPGDGRMGLLTASTEREWARVRALLPEVFSAG